MHCQPSEQQDTQWQSMMIAAAAAAAGALGSRCTWLGAEKGTAKRWHRRLTYYAGRAELFTNREQRGFGCRENWAHCIQGSRHLSRGFHTGRVGATLCRKQNKIHTHTQQNKTKKTPSPLPLNAHPDAVAEAQFCTQTKRLMRNPRSPRLRAGKSVLLSCNFPKWHA